MFVSIKEAIADMRQGKFVILVDAADREDEADLVVAAEFITSAKVNTLVRRAGGMFLFATTEEHLTRLDIPLIEGRNREVDTPRFALPFDARNGITTGIGAADRAHTIKETLRPDAKAGEFVIPGHVAPLAAHPRGLAARQGHTEGAVSLARLAGLFPAVVMSEIMNKKGEMAKGEEIAVFAQELDCRVIHIDRVCEALEISI